MDCTRDHGGHAADSRLQVKPERIAGLAPFFVLAAVLLFTYSGSIVTPFGFSDDYRFLADMMRGKHSEISALMLPIGRPITNFLIQWVYSNLSDIANLRCVRFAAVVGIIVLGWGLYRALIDAGQSPVSSTLVAIVICVMPPFQVYACWGQYFPVPYAALAAGTGARLACSADHAPTTLGMAVRFAAAALLVCLAACVYQPAAMFFWVFMAIALLNPATAYSGIRRYLVVSFGAAGAGLAAAFGIMKLGQAAYANNISGGRTAFLDDISGKLSWFIREPLLNALNFVNLPPSRHVALIVGGLMVCGLLIHFLLCRRQLVWRVVLLLLFIPLSYLPNLMVSENWASYRTQGALVSLLFIYAFMALRGYGALVLPRVPTLVSWAATVVSGLAALAIALSAAYHVNTCFAFPQLLELNLVRQQVREQDPAQAKAVHFIQAHWTGGVAPIVMYDEFGLPSSFQRWVPQATVYLVLREMNPDWADLPVTTLPWDNHTAIPSDSLIIDMRQLREYR